MATKKPQFCRNRRPKSHETLHNQLSCEIADRLFPRTNSSWHFVRSQALLFESWRHNVVSHLGFPITSDFLPHPGKMCKQCVSILVQTCAKPILPEKEQPVFLDRIVYSASTTNIFFFLLRLLYNQNYAPCVPCTLLLQCTRVYVCQWCLVIMNIYHQRILDQFANCQTIQLKMGRIIIQSSSVGEANFFQPVATFGKFGQLWTVEVQTRSWSTSLSLYQRRTELQSASDFPVIGMFTIQFEHAWVLDFMNVTIPKSYFRSDWGQYQRNAVLTKHSQRVTGRWFWGFQGSARNKTKAVNERCFFSLGATSCADGVNRLRDLADLHFSLIATALPAMSPDYK